MGSPRPPRPPIPAKPEPPDDAPLADDDSSSVAGEEDPGASLDTTPAADALNPGSAPAPAPADTSRVRRPRRG